MKNFQQNLLIGLALALCVLCIYQWYGQTLQRNEIQGLTQLVYQRSVAIRDCTNSIATLNHQIAQMDTELSGLKATVQEGEQRATGQRAELERLRAVNDGLTNQVAAYRKAVDTQEVKLKEAYAGINKQNESLKELVAQRDEFVKKYNDSVRDRNEIVARYNELAAQVEKQQSGGNNK